MSARIVHVSGDYPDAYAQGKTQAVKNLVHECTAFDHVVYSLNRVSTIDGVRARDRSAGVVSLTYGAPPYGIFLETFLNHVADWIADDIHRSQLTVDLVHAHKMTIEGLIARRLGARLSRPYVCTLMGNTDQKYLRAKPEKKSVYRAVITDAAHIFPAAPWIYRYALHKLGVSEIEIKATVLPMITHVDRLMPSPLAPGRFVTAFDLQRWRPKGLANLLSALRRVRQRGHNISLDIIGDGSPAVCSTLSQRVERLGLTHCVRFLGHLDHAAIQSTLNNYAAFVMPTLTETFGMVYMEALFSGIPILYSSGRGVDGFFDDCTVGVRCDPTRVDEIADGLIFLDQNELNLKTSIQQHHQGGIFKEFQKPAITGKYSSILREIIKST